MVEILIAAVLGGLVGAFGTAAWLRRSASAPARERRSGGAAAALQRSILDSLQDGVVVYDEDDRIVFHNPAAAEILGVSREALTTGVRTWDPLDGEGRPIAADERPVAITARTGEPCVGADIGLRTATGDLRWTTVSTRALHEEPAPNGRYAVVAAFTDITERRRRSRRWSAPTRSSPSSPTSPRTTSPSRCGWSPATCSCCAAATTARSTRTRRVHRLRGRGRQPDARADRGPARLLARRPRRRAAPGRPRAT